MKKYILNPKEELTFETQPNTLTQARVNNRVFLVGSIILVLLSVFFFYVMQSIPNFYPLLVLIGLIAIACLVYYVSGIYKGLKGSDEKYYLTNVRAIVCDEDDNVKKEIYLSDIKKVTLDKVSGQTYDVVINPKEETNPTKLRKHKSNKPLYSEDTIILYAVDGNKIKQLLGK